MGTQCCKGAFLSSHTLHFCDSFTALEEKTKGTLHQLEMLPEWGTVFLRADWDPNNCSLAPR